MVQLEPKDSDFFVYVLRLSDWSKFSQTYLRDAFKKRVNFGTLAQKWGGGPNKIPNVDQY